jgi:hypothetical protein
MSTPRRQSRVNAELTDGQTGAQMVTKLRPRLATLITIQTDIAENVGARCHTERKL